MHEPIFIKSKVTGGHYGFKTNKGKKPFENPMSECKSIKLLPSDIVIDIGAYVGEYSIIANNSKVLNVISYEATPDTFKVLSMNKKPLMEIYNKAVVGDNSETVNLYISKGIGVTNSIKKIDNKSCFITVPAIKYEEAIKNGSVVKIDVEGAEYSYNILGNLSNIRAIIIEFHPIVKFNWKEYAQDTLQSIINYGFKPIKLANFKSGWSLISSFER